MKDNIRNGRGGPLAHSVARIRWEEDGEKKEQTIGTRKITIGRAEENEITVKDSKASRFHCFLKHEAGRYIVVDLDSTNGTFVNEQRVEETIDLRNGDTVQVGDVGFLFEVFTPEPIMVAPAGQTVRLVWQENQIEQEKMIRSGGLTIGRSQENDLVIKEQEASRYHCKIAPQAGAYILIDLDSTNGTFLNKERVVGSKALKNGDLIQIGKLGLQFEISTPEAATLLAMRHERVSEFLETSMPIVPDAKADVVINLRNIVKEYDTPAGPLQVLKGIDLDIRTGEFIAIRGPSGSGKSTLINMITGIDRPTSGEVVVAGQTLTGLDENKMSRWRGEHIGVIFQFFQLLPTLTVIENVMLPMDFCQKWDARERQDKAMSLLDSVGLAEHAYKLPSALSGGQQQRAAISRALANDPPLIVGDEPTGNLDSKTADQVFAMFEDLVAKGTTFLMVTHDVDLAARIPRNIEVLDGEIFEDRR